MEDLKIVDQRATLVDQIEEKLLNFFVEQNYHIGDTLPNETELSSSLGVARNVLREALSRFKMIGLIERRTRRGMVITEPSIFYGMKLIFNPQWMTEKTLIDILELRVALEIGITDSIFQNITPSQIHELENIVETGIALEGKKYAPISEAAFHMKLYEISRNNTVIKLQDIFLPVMEYIKEKFKDYFEPVSEILGKDREHISHAQLLDCIKKGDKEAYFKAIRQHLILYTEYIDLQKEKRDLCNSH